MRPRLLLLLGLVILGGCGRCDTPLVTDMVVITYRPLYNFSAWEVRDSNGDIFARGKIDDGLYLRYRIVSIKNNDSQAKLFHFNPSKIFASDPSERPENVAIPGLAGALPFDVAPGTIVTNRLNLTIKVKGQPENQFLPLHYESGPGEHVLLATEDPNVTSVPYVNPLRIPGNVN